MSTETLLEKMNLKQRLETLETDAQKTASDLNRQTDQLDGEPQKRRLRSAFLLSHVAVVVSAPS